MPRELMHASGKASGDRDAIQTTVFCSSTDFRRTTACTLFWCVDGVRFLTLLLVSQEQTQECMHDEINCRKINLSRNRLDMRGASARSAQSLASESVGEVLLLVVHSRFKEGHLSAQCWMSLSCGEPDQAGQLAQLAQLAQDALRHSCERFGRRPWYRAHSSERL